MLNASLSGLRCSLDPGILAAHVVTSDATLCTVRPPSFPTARTEVHGMKGCLPCAQFTWVSVLLYCLHVLFDLCLSLMSPCPLSSSPLFNIEIWPSRFERDQGDADNPQSHQATKPRATQSQGPAHKHGRRRIDADGGRGGDGDAESVTPLVARRVL